MKNNKQGSSYPPAAERTLQILDFFAADPSAKTLKTVADHLQIPSTSLYRIISCMQEYRYIVEDPERPNYFKLGYKLTQFSTVASIEQNLVKIARPYMEEITRKTSQACQLCMLSDIGVYTLDQCLPKSVITYITELGETLPINVSAAGKLLTALLPAKRQKTFLKQAEKLFSANTQYTITDMTRFKKDLERIRKVNYSTDVEEYALGIGCIAVPIYGYDKDPVAAIGLTGPIEYYRDIRNFNTALEDLFDLSAKIGENLL